MLRKIVEISEVTCSYYNLIAIFGLVCLLSAEGACASKKIGYESEGSLKKRVQQFYDNWKELKYSECMAFLAPDMIQDKEAFLERARQASSRLVEYAIVAIKIDGHNAEVTMLTTAVEDKGKITVTIVDSWTRISGTWYMIDFGRAADKGQATKPPEM